MKKNFICMYLFLLATLASCQSCSSDYKDVDDIVVEGVETPVLLGDPFIMLHDGTYYAYGTHADDGIEVYTSDDLKTWKYKGMALQKKDVWADRWFWAPEVYEVNGKFYMYYSADERFNDGLNIWVAELEKDLMTIKKETMHPCIHVSQAWEEVWPRVNEGPFVIKHNGLYYMTYSANSYESPFYGIGCATATDLMGTWTKYEENPLLQKPGELVGVGHSATFTDKAGKLRIVFHAHKDKSSIHPRAMYISDVSFEKVDGVDRMRISKDYMTPKIVK